jgi:hypothetical protein
MSSDVIDLEKYRQLANEREKSKEAAARAAEELSLLSWFDWAGDGDDYDARWEAAEQADYDARWAAYEQAERAAERAAEADKAQDLMETEVDEWL